MLQSRSTFQILKTNKLLVLLVLVIFGCDSDEDLVVTCDSVNNISANTITDTSASVTWNANNASASYNFEYGLSGFSIGSGTLISQTGATANLTALNPSTVYDVYVQTICSETNVSMYTDVFSFSTLAASPIPQFRPTLSELNIFTGDLSDLQPSEFAFEYDLNTPLFADYAHKQRLIVLPDGEKMTYAGDGLPVFPDNTLIVKTFYYHIDERDVSLGRNIIETRILIKINGLWETGDYKWNDSQTEAILDPLGSVVPVSWIDTEGVSNTLNYNIPPDTQCFTCHRTNDLKKPIGPKLRALNFSSNGVNQLQQFIDNEHLQGLSTASNVSVLPRWDDDINFSLEERARAYFEINCAHCHTAGGYCENQSTLRLDFETSLADSNIENRKNSINLRVGSNFQPGFTMPWLGTTILHNEGVDVILQYLDTL